MTPSRRLLLVSLLSVVRSEELTLRLSGGKFTEAGYVQVWRGGRWGAMCVARPGDWSKSSADVVCRHLGYSDSLQHSLGDTPYAAVPSSLVTVTDGLACSQGEGLGSLSQCQLSFSQTCHRDNVLSVICRPESKSACGPQSTAMFGHCYRIFPEGRTFPEAQAECQKISANLVEILSQKENILVSSMIQKTTNYPDLSRFWTGGVVSEIANAKFMIWHGSQNKIEFDNQVDKNKATEKPHGISLQTNLQERFPTWKTVDFDTKLPFICQYATEKIGCLEDEDPTGSKYTGSASHDKDGDECATWNEASDGGFQWTDNLCRNPDNSESPYCLLSSGEPSPCDIPLCQNQAPRFPPYPQLCGEGSAGSVNTCHKEEYRCSSGECVSRHYVCDGSPDCPNGDDEADCRVLSSLFSSLEGYKLEGQLKEAASESVRASLEECASLCLYQKLKGTGCCDSFSHRKAKDGKDDRCTLGSVYVTNSLSESFDNLVEKKSWNYYKLNDTSSSQCLRRRRPRVPEIPIEALRMNNKKKGSKGNLVEVKFVNGGWGRVCADGFGATEAAVVCRQLGHEESGGAGRVVAVPGRGEDVVLSSTSCQGTETSLADCRVSRKGRCSSGQVVAVDCTRAETQCGETEFQCETGECVPISGLCDGQTQCRDGSDESYELCLARTQVRLTQPGGSEGLLELRHQGVWGSVCDYNFGQGEADVFCHMLGYDRAEEGGWTSGEVEVTRSGSWPVWISFGSKNTCAGWEQSLEECHDKTFWKHDGSCRHSEDVFLRCKNDDPALQRSSQPGGQDQVPPTRQVVDKCGLWRRLPEDTRASQRVAGGRNAEHGTLPWQASIRIRGPDNKSYHHCGAVLITPFHVLTTAHCLWSYRDNLEIYYVRVGDNQLEIPDNEEQEFTIEKVDFHEYYNVGPYLNNDIAVVHIDKVRHSKGIVFGDKVIPACLPQSTADYRGGVNVTVSGWGKNGFDQTERSGPNSVSRLHMATVPIIDNDICRSQRVYGEEKITNGMFCAGRLEGGVDSCQGDSGGPAVSFLNLPEAGEVRATVLGLTSWGHGCGRPNKPGVYTRVSKYVSWIYERVKQ